MHYSIINHNCQQKYVRQFTPKPQIIIRATNVALHDIEHSFQLEIDRLPPNSLLALINKHRNFYTRNITDHNVNTTIQTIQLDFSDGIIKLIEMYFFEKDSEKKTIVNKKF